MKKESILKRLNTEVAKVFDKKILPECGSINKLFLINKMILNIQAVIKKKR